MTKIFASVAVIALSGIATSSFAQTGATATATASATIITPISIVKNVDMDFGTLAVNSTIGGGTIVMTAATPAVRSITGGVSLPAITVLNTAPTAAKFTVTGMASYTYLVTLPGTPVTLNNGSAHMDATSFVTNLAGGIGTLDVSTGLQSFYVGATLTVAAGQLAGPYVSSNFNVSVDYN